MTDEEKVEELLWKIADELGDKCSEYSAKSDDRGRSDIERLVAEREKNAVEHAKLKLENAAWKLNKGVFLTKCCDVETRTLPSHSFGQGQDTKCKECGEKNPETYNVEKSVEDLIEEYSQLFPEDYKMKCDPFDTFTDPKFSKTDETEKKETDK